MTPHAMGKRNEIARMLTLGAGRPQQQQQPMAAPAYVPPAAPAAAPYSEAGFGYNEKLTPLEEIGMAWAKRK